MISGETPGRKKGHEHPISQAIAEMNSIFYEMGFSMADGPEIEDEWHNFDALNVPPDHPSRDMQDTFFIKGGEGKLLRTHTSPVQIRYMEKHNPPLRIIVPGRTYRNEATDATHEAQFYQIEGLAIDTDITLGNLKWTLEIFLSKFFGKKVEMRFRPAYFPFVEPGVEVDIKHVSSRGEQWLELLGGGMVRPDVLISAGVNPNKYQGYAFGLGIERLLMIRHEIDDIRLFSSGDLRFVNQF